MNPTRLSFIRSTLCRHFRRDPYSSMPLEGLKVIDVGCGGGILSEPLARMGATVTAIDAVDKNIKIASIHAACDPTTASIEYCCTTAGLSLSSASCHLINHSLSLVLPVT
uniref:Methyltransferase type 11 domain-containing protein n=1 Tax=Arundo donax TaxID=35708 RepID=A0A0A9CXE0_ARUDO